MIQNRILPAVSTSFVLFFAAFSISVSLQAQEEEDSWACRDKETWNNCFQRLRSASSAEQEAAMATNSIRQAEADTHAQNVLTGLAATGNAAAKRTFLPAFLASLGIDGLEDRNGTLAFTYNPGRFAFGHLSAEILAKPPEVFEQLKAKIPEDMRDARVSALKDSLSDFDNVEGSFTLDVTGGPQNRFGRILGDYDPGLGEDLFKMANESPEVKAQASAARTALVNAQVKLQLVGEEEVKTTKDRDPSFARQLDQMVNEGARESLATADSIVKALDERKYFQLADLAANQPQLYFTGAVKQRDPIVGTNSWLFMGTWEIPVGANINKLRKSCNGPVNFDCYKAYVDKAETQGSLAVKSRFKVIVSGGEESAYDYSIPDLGVALHFDRIRTLLGSATYGRSLRQDDEGNDLSRFDFEAKYEDVTGDEERQNRLVAMATLTQKFTDDMDFAITAVWANKPEYRGDVDKEWGARAGLRYKVDRKSQ
ncbi:MAG TPA: hypothetical protein VGS22_21475 [Thermoanaerobaculia bacterium]|jgi:hypothetical protein|nr:hypothetical protein [Thermoanaerobaculia bacterium]